MRPRSLLHLATGGALAVGLAACRDLPDQAPTSAPRSVRPTFSASSTSACTPATAVADLRVLRAAVQALPSPAAVRVRTQLLPAVDAAQAAVQRGDPAAAAAALRTLVAEVGEFRLHVPLATQLALASSARCIIDALSASGR